MSQHILKNNDKPKRHKKICHLVIASFSPPYEQNVGNIFLAAKEELTLRPFGGITEIERISAYLSLKALKRISNCQWYWNEHSFLQFSLKAVFFFNLTLATDTTLLTPAGMNTHDASTRRTPFTPTGLHFPLFEKSTFQASTSSEPDALSVALNWHTSPFLHVQLNFSKMFGISPTPLPHRVLFAN